MGKNKSKEIAKETSISVIQQVISELIPFGNAINEALFGISGKIQQKRINEFVIYLRSRVLELELNTINEEYLKSEDFYDLTRNIFESVIKTKSQAKHQALAKIYLSGITEKIDIENDLISIFSRFILELMPQQVQIMLFIEKFEDELIEIGSYENLYKLFVEKHANGEIGKYELKYFCGDLEYKALVSFGAGLEDYDSQNLLTAFLDHKEASAKLTDLGKKFIEYLKE